MAILTIRQIAAYFGWRLQYLPSRVNSTWAAVLPGAGRRVLTISNVRLSITCMASLLGQSAYVILDNFGRMGYILWALLYPLGLGTMCAWIGYHIFRRSDLP